MVGDLPPIVRALPLKMRAWAPTVRAPPLIVRAFAADGEGFAPRGRCQPLTVGAWPLPPRAYRLIVRALPPKMRALTAIMGAGTLMVSG
jgi:hypothetical protein